MEKFKCGNCGRRMQNKNGKCSACSDNIGKAHIDIAAKKWRRNKILFSVLVFLLIFGVFALSGCMTQDSSYELGADAGIEEILIGESTWECDPLDRSFSCGDGATCGFESYDSPEPMCLTSQGEDRASLFCEAHEDCADGMICFQRDKKHMGVCTTYCDFANNPGSYDACNHIYGPVWGGPWECKPFKDRVGVCLPDTDR